MHKKFSAFPIIFCLTALMVACQKPTTLMTNTPTLVPATIATLPAQISSSNPDVMLQAQSPAMLGSAKDELQTLPTLAHYNLSLSVDIPSLSYQGHARISLVNSETKPLDRLYFRLLPNGGKSYGNGSLTVSQTAMDGQAVESQLSQDNTVLELLPPEPLLPGGSVVVDLEFNGSVPRDYGGGEQPGGYGIYNFSEGVLALSGWYPILAVYDEDGWNLDPVAVIGDSVFSETAFYNVELLTPKNQVIAATGIEVEQEQQGDQVLHSFVTGPVRDFFIVMSSDYKVTHQQVNGVRVNAYILPGHEERGRLVLAETAGSLQVFNEIFGEYPYAELDVVDAPMNRALGVEYPAIFLVSSAHIAEGEETSLIITTVHETAHQWWYALIGNDVFEEPWLDEALATYSSAVYIQSSKGQDFYQGYSQYLQERYDQLISDGKDEAVAHPLEYFVSLNDPVVYSRVVYTKGALFLKALRAEIGDEAFFAALRIFADQQRYSVARGEALLSLFEEQAGRSLDVIYARWLFKD